MKLFYPFTALIYVIMDNAGYHDSGEVLKCLETSRTRLVLLPPHSPNLNLIERLWMLLKEKVVYNKYYEKHKDFRDACVVFFKNLKHYENELTSLMSEQFQIITKCFAPKNGLRSVYTFSVKILVLKGACHGK